MGVLGQLLFALEKHHCKVDLQQQEGDSMNAVSAFSQLTQLREYQNKSLEAFLDEIGPGAFDKHSWG